METSQDTEDRPRRTGRPLNEAAGRAILDAAIELLGEGGYAGLTIDAVAARARVGRPTIYRRWPNKAALVIAALARSTGLAPAPDTGSLRGDLLAVQRHQVQLINSPGFTGITPGLIADLNEDPEVAENYLTQYIAPRRASVWEALQRGIERGELRPDVDFAFISDLMTGPLFYRKLVRGETLEPRLVEATVDVVLAAYGRAEPRIE